MKSSIIKAARALWKATPMILGTILLISLSIDKKRNIYN